MEMSRFGNIVNRKQKLMLVSLVLLMSVMVGAIAINPAAAKTTVNGRNAALRLIHASPDAPAVDVWINGQPVFMDIKFKDITPYTTLKSGTYNIQVVPHGATTPVVINANVTLQAKTFYTVVAIGKLASIRPLVLVDNNSKVRDDMVRVRFVHASPDAPAVDIAVKNGPVLFSNVSFEQSGGYILVPNSPL